MALTANVMETVEEKVQEPFIYKSARDAEGKGYLKKIPNPEFKRVFEEEEKPKKKAANKKAKK